MSSDKILHKIQLQIDELAPTLELFVDETVQPSVKDCENLQRQLTLLQENLAVFKYNKQNKELSPSFNIHAKVSEKEVAVEKKAEIVQEIKETVKLDKEEKTEPISVAPEVPKTETVKIEPQRTEVPKQETATKSLQPMSVGLNDKFRFINDLFSQNSSEYNIAIEQLNNVSSWDEAEIYLNSLKSVYEWDAKEEVVKNFFSSVRKRFE